MGESKRLGDVCGRSILAVGFVTLLAVGCAEDPVQGPLRLDPRGSYSVLGRVSAALTSSIPSSVVFEYSVLPIHRAYDVNDHDVVVGDTGSNNIAAYWTQTTGLVVLGQVITGSTACCSSLLQLNSNDEAVGVSTVGGQGGGCCALTKWTLSSHAYVDVPTGIARNFAQGINDHGEIATADDAGGGRPYYRSPSGSMTMLSMAPSYVAGWTTDINNGGVITGYLALVGAGWRAVAWQNFAAAPVALGTLGGNQSQAIAINQPGDIVGWSEATPGNPVRYATLWPATGGIVDLRKWPNPCLGSSEAADVSDRGVIVGRCDARPVLWTAREGMRYLPLPAGTTSGEAWGINNKHVIVGVAPERLRGALWEPANAAPQADAGGPYGGVEGSAVSFDGSVSHDPEGDALTYAWDFGDGQTGTGMTPAHTYRDNGTYLVTLAVTDAHGAASTPARASAVIDNVAPSLGALVGPGEPVALLNGAVAPHFEASFTDPGTLDTHTGTVSCDGGSAGAVSVSETAGSGLATTTCTFGSAGVYQVSLTLSDSDLGSDTEAGATYVVVYDPAGGFVTGGGWINSPAGAYASDPSLGGKATFGFVSKYGHGAAVPSGNTEFQFQAGGLNFSSAAYEWLVVAGARAQFKGTGTVNGQAGYRFLLSAVDGEANGGGGLDRFRIKIWDGTSAMIVYDNAMGASDDIDGASPQAIGGGSISIKR